MAVNKVVYGSTTVLDLTGVTVTAATLCSGYTAHDKSGRLITGTLGLTPKSNTDSGTVGPSKVVVGTSTKIDLTSDTVHSGVLLRGYTAINKKGQLITGVLDPGFQFPFSNESLTEAKLEFVAD